MFVCNGGDATQTLPRNGVQRNSSPKTQQSGHAPGLKMEEESQKWCAEKVQMRNTPEGSEPDPSVVDRMRYKKNSRSTLSCLVKWTKSLDRGSKDGTVPNEQEGKKHLSAPAFSRLNVLVLPRALLSGGKMAVQIP